MMGAMSINISPTNELWLRSKAPGRMSAVVNTALDQHRRIGYAKKTGVEVDVQNTPTTTLARVIQKRCIGTPTAMKPFGNLTEKEFLRLTQTIEMMLSLIEEMEVIE